MVLHKSKPKMGSLVALRQSSARTATQDAEQQDKFSLFHAANSNFFDGIFKNKG
jgi:hypothetical protein